jgi:hypothetical protein
MIRKKSRSLKSLRFRKGWIAMDENGEWYWYNVKPTTVMHSWSFVIPDEDLYCFRLPEDIFQFPKIRDWRKSLRRVG